MSKLYQCEICDKQYKYYKDLMLHMDKIHCRRSEAKDAVNLKKTSRKMSKCKLNYEEMANKVNTNEWQKPSKVISDMILPSTSSGIIGTSSYLGRYFRPKYRYSESNSSQSSSSALNMRDSHHKKDTSSETNGASSYPCRYFRPRYCYSELSSNHSSSAFNIRNSDNKNGTSSGVIGTPSCHSRIFRSKYCYSESNSNHSFSTSNIGNSGFKNDRSRVHDNLHQNKSSDANFKYIRRMITDKGGKRQGKTQTVEQTLGKDSRDSNGHRIISNDKYLSCTTPQICSQYNLRNRTCSSNASSHQDCSDYSKKRQVPMNVKSVNAIVSRNSQDSLSSSTSSYSTITVGENENDVSSRRRTTNSRVAPKGKTKRIKWTKNMNKDVIYLFMRINNSNKKYSPDWRKKLFTEFKKLYPMIQLSEQNLANRKSTIIKNKYLSELEISEIRRQVDDELQAGKRQTNDELQAREGQVYEEVQVETVTNLRKDAESTTVRSEANVQRGASNGRRGVKNIRWSKEMNTDVISAFLYVNECRDDPLPGWRHRLYQEFSRRYPNTILSEQNLADRRNMIYKQRYLDLDEINVIRREVGKILHNEQYDIQTERVLTQPNSSADDLLNQDQERNTDKPDDLCEKLIANVHKYQHTEFSKRPRVPVLKMKSQTPVLMAQVNTALRRFLHDTDSLVMTHLAIYAAAVTLTEINGQTTYLPCEGIKHTLQVASWKMRILQQINEFRSKSNIIEEHLRGNKGKKVRTKIYSICKAHKIDLSDHQAEQQLTCLRDNMRQKLKAKGARLRRYNLTSKRKLQNSMFFRSQKIFYRNLERKDKIETKITNEDKSKFLQYWATIWSNPGKANVDAEWVKDVENEVQSFSEMEEVNFSEQDIRKATQKMSNWKAPGPDHLQNFWLKKLTGAHEALTRSFNKVIVDPTSFPDKLAAGNTTLLYKKGETNDPCNYRPITCLSTTYKLLTSLIHEKIYSHCDNNGIIAPEQKGCTRGTMGCKEQLTIDTITVKHATIKRRNLSMAYIDYAKAFDSVPHDWLLHVLKIYKVHPNIVAVLREVMKHWKVNLKLDNHQLGHVRIARGIYQGDTLSPLWFVMALNPLSSILHRINLGYRWKVQEHNRLSHLLFMDDLKLYAESNRDLYRLISATKQFSTDIQMAFGTDKCAYTTLRSGKYSQQDENIQDVRPLLFNETYRYLGIAQGRVVNQTILKEQFKEKYRYRLTKLLNTTLNAKNLTKAINTWAVPVLTYSFGVLKYSDVDLEELNRMTRRTLTKFRCHHPKSAVERVYLPRNEGGRGLIDIHKLCRKLERSLQHFFLQIDNPLVRTICRMDNNYSPLSLADALEDDRDDEEQSLQITWKEKILHGKYPKILESSGVSKHLSLLWLMQGYLHTETEGFLIAIQDGVIKTRNYQKYIIKENVVDVCRKCQKPGETIDHVIAGCSELATNAYLCRHNQAAKIIHIQLAVRYELLNNPLPYYKYQPAPVLESKNYLLYWDRPITTDRTVDYNRPDIVVIEKNSSKAFIIDIGCPLSQNVLKTEAEKINKYANLAIEIKHIWKIQETVTVPIIISATGVVSKNLPKHLEKLKIKENLIQNLQRAVILQTCHIVRKFLNM